MPDHLPLHALRAFEVAARTGSFVAAGEELGVSSAAVSQQVKALERTLNRTLFLRIGNRITLTDAGRALYPRLETVFSDLAALTRDLREGAQPSRLRVSALPSLAELWLIPALARFPGRAMVDLVIEADPIDFARSGSDLRVTYGAQYYPDHHVQTLFRDHFIAVAAPRFSATLQAGRGRESAMHLPDTALIHTDWGRDHIRQPDWAEWFAAQGSARAPQRGSGLRVGSTLAAAHAAIAGAGAALVPAQLAAAALASGSLEALGTATVPLFADYVLIHPHALQRKRSLKALCDFLAQAE
jgi:LysR family glycine cleavage system transcriptional activator